MMRKPSQDFARRLAGRPNPTRHTDAGCFRQRACAARPGAPGATSSPPGSGSATLQGWGSAQTAPVEGSAGHPRELPCSTGVVLPDCCHTQAGRSSLMSLCGHHTLKRATPALGEA